MPNQNDSSMFFEKHFYPLDANHAFPCNDSNCMQAVNKNERTGRWFITMGHAGFNSPLNNGRGYSEFVTAFRAFRKYNSK